MVTRHTRGKTTWIDLESPTHAELSEVMREFGIDERIEEEIISQTHYPLAISFPKYQYLILHFPTSDPGSGTRNQEIDFIVGKNFLITARYEVIDTIHSLHRVFEAEELLGLPRADAQTAHLLERVLKRLYGAIREEMERASRLLEHIEVDMFNGKERETVRSISDLGRVLLRFQTTISRHKEPLTIFLERLTTPAFFGKSFNEHAVHIEGEHAHVVELVSSYRIVATELRLTNDSILSASQNEVMKVLTIMAFVTFPLSLITGIFGMNTVSVPIVGLEGDFWIIIGFMCLVAVSFFTFFRFKKWL